YMVSKADGETLDEYLENKVFAGQDSTEISPDADDIAGFKAFLENYKKGLAAEKAAVEAL
ncbi:MAG: ATPase, partial [Acutalibacteraceae bacterium]|nr:ATPase [Acutalibacteraceae bacterium]